MRKLIMIASAAAMAAAMPALAKPGQGGGRAQAGAKADVRAGGVRARADARARTDARTQARARTRTTVDRQRDTDGDGIPDYRERRVDQNRHAGQACPPGLANRTPACVPPGQARRMFSQGERIPTGYDYFTRYEDIPLTVRERYQIPTGFDYIYRDQSVYLVDPTTRLVTRIIDLLR